jgi:hypothetical protein
MSANLSQWQRNLMLQYPVAWLAGWHLALPVATGCLGLSVMLAALRDRSAYRDDYALPMLLLLIIMIGAPVLLLLRSAAQAANTTLTRRQTWQWYASLTGVMTLFVALPPTTWVLRNWWAAGAGRLPFGLDASETIVTACISMMLALGFVTLAVTHGQSQGRRWTAQLAVGAPPVLLMIGLLAGEMLNWRQMSGMYATSAVLMVPVLLAWRSRPVRVGAHTLSPQDLSVVATGPLFGVLIILGLGFGDEYVRALPYGARPEAWATLWLMILGLSIPGYAAMVAQLRPTRMLGDRE